MPRKSSSSGFSQDSKASSLRRFGSLASFNSLAFLTRTRRSNNACDNAPTSPPTSDISLHSSLTNSTNQSTSQSTARPLAHKPAPEKSLPPTPTRQDQWPTRKDSYMPLAVDAGGTMPRSRTLSYLPIATRLTSRSTSQHHLQPAARSSRIPSTAVSTRKHETSRPSRLPRSDTEPLLASSLHEANGDDEPTPRTLDLKENMKYGQTKSGSARLAGQMSSKDWRESSSSPTKEGEPLRHGEGTPVATLSIPPKPSLVSRYRNHEASPMYRSSPTKVQPDVRGPPSRVSRAQRWNSQPALLNRINLRSSHQPIEERRLLSTRGPPTPLLQTRPLGQTTATESRKFRIVDDGANNLLQISEEDSSRIGTRPSPVEHKQLCEVDSWEPVAYWCGRFTALCDRFRNEELCSAFSEATTKKGLFGTKPRNDTDKLNTNDAHTLRQRRALETLYSYCITHEACDSLVAFQLEYAIANKTPEFAKELKPKSIIKLGGAAVAGVENSEEASKAAGWSSVRRSAFMSRLAGKTSDKRRSWVA